MFKFPSIRHELLPEANGKKATDELAAIRLDREQSAITEHAKRLQEMGSPLATAATRGAGMENPVKTSSAVVFEEPTAVAELNAIKTDLEAAESAGDPNVFKLPKSQSGQESADEVVEQKVA